MKMQAEEKLLCKIVKDNKFICKPYALEEAEVKQISKKLWGIQADGEALGTIEIENNLFKKKICYMWDKAKLEKRKE